MAVIVFIVLMLFWLFFGCWWGYDRADQCLSARPLSHGCV